MFKDQTQEQLQQIYRQLSIQVLDQLMLEYLEEERREKDNQQLQQRNQIQKDISKQDRKSKKEHKNKKNKKRGHSSSSSSSSLVSLPSQQMIEESRKNIKKDVKNIQDKTINIKEKKNEIPLFEFDVEPLTKQENTNLIEYEINGIRRLSTNSTIFERIGKLNDQVDQLQEDQQQLNDMDGYDFWTISRYFNRNPFEQCYRCKQSGHTEKQCVEQIKLFCQYCLSQEHTGDKCNNVSCFKCNQFGHRKFECTLRTKYPYCLRCNHNSHRTDECGMLSIYKENIEVTCLKCLNQGHINCNVIQLNDSIY